ncbi:hypothetical protein [Priestia megaterium]|uniref:hypothetical protein n=1 Tax=Priestia megaterium TaxID=1404 RepID=UPI00209D95CC|nr:hypothetical protein [Priestia megaterium]MCP1450336.1 uncharacterized protein (UPF0305 family) [Priestia megaterium]
MGNEYELNELVRSNIRKYNINGGVYESLRPKVQDQLYKIEYYIQSYIQEQIELVSKIKASKLSLAGVITASELQRSTVYNNADTLKKYIEERINDIESQDILSIRKITKQKEDIEFLKQYLENLELRLVQEEINENKIMELESQYSFISKCNIELQKEAFQLRQQNNILTKEITALKKNNIISLKTKNNGN